MKLKILIFAIVIFVIGEIFFIISKFSSFTDSREEISKRISTLVDGNVNIKGKVDVDIFPYPKIIISHVRIYDFAIGSYKINIRSPLLTADISLLNIFTGKMKFSDLHFKNSKIDFYKNKKNIIIDYSLLPKKNLHISDSALSFYDNDGNIIRQLDKFSFNLNRNEKFTFDGFFVFNKQAYKYNSEIAFEKNLIKSNLNIYSDSDKLSIEKINGSKSNDYAGTVSLSGANFQNLLFNLFPENWFLYPDGRNYKYDINFSITNKNNKISIINGNINGDAISGSFFGDIDDNSGGKFSFLLDNLDMVGIITEKKKSFVLKDFSVNDYYNLLNNFTDNQIYIEGIIDNISLSDREIGPVTVNMMASDNKFNIDKFDFSLGKNNVNKISGIITRDKNNYILSGSISSNGDNVKDFLNSLTGLKFDNSSYEDGNYNLSSQFTLSNDKLFFDNITGKFGAGYVTGNVKWLIDDISSSNINMSFFNLDSKDFQIFNSKGKSQHILDFHYGILSDRTGTNSLLSRFLWLRSIFNNINFNINFSNLKYNSHLFDSVNLSGILKFRNLIFENIHMLSKDNDIKINALISIDDEEPKFDVNLDVNKANLSFLDYEKDNISNKINAWSRNLILFPNFDNVLFNFNANIKKLYYRGLDINNSLINFNVSNNLLEINEFNGGFANDGNFNIAGEFLMDGLPQLALSYNLENVEINNLVKFALNKDNIFGKITLSGNLQTYGNTPNVMFKQLKSRNKFVLSNLEIAPLDISGILQSLADMSDDPYNSFEGDIRDHVLKSSTIIGNSKGDINVEKGVMILNNLKFNLPGMNSVIAGKVDLSSKSLAINTILSFVTFYRVQDMIKKMPVTLSNNISGNFNNVKSNYDFAQLELLINKLKSLYIDAFDELNEYNSNVE